MKTIALVFLIGAAACGGGQASAPAASSQRATRPAVVAASAIASPPAASSPDDTAYLRLRDMVENWDGDLTVVDEARDGAMKMLESDPASARAYVILSRCEFNHAYVGGDEWELQGTIRARKLIDHALKLDPAAFDAVMQSARISNAQRDYDLAVQALDDAERLHPGDGEVKAERARVLRETGQLREAVKLATAALASDARPAVKWRASFELAAIQNHSGFKDAADATYRQSLALRPDSAWGHGNYAGFLLNRGDVDHAITEAERAVKLKPYPIAVQTLARAYIMKASSLYDANDYRGSGTYIERALSLAGTNARTVAAAGFFYDRAFRRAHDPELKVRAIAAFQKSLELDSANDAVQKELAALMAN